MLKSAERLQLPTSLSLVSRLRKQDADGWRTFVSLYAPLVARWCKRQSLNEHDTEDIAQEVFRKVAEHIGGFHKNSPADSFRGWLCRITHRAIVDFVHRRKHHLAQGGTDALSRLNQFADRPVLGPDENECSEETSYLFHQVMKAARSEFSERVWEMFWRVAVDGNAAPAVAAEFEATPAMVRQAKSRVLRRLKQLVGDLVD